MVNGTHVGDFTVPGTGKLDPAVPFGGRFYVADQAAGTVYALDADGKLVDTIVIPNAGGKLELEVRGEHLFINAPNSSGARVVDDKGRVKVVDKYANNILGGDPPPNPPPPPPQKPPTVGPATRPDRSPFPEALPCPTTFPITMSALSWRAVAWRTSSASGSTRSSLSTK